MGKKELKNTEMLGEVKGLYSQAIQCGDFIFTTQIGNVCGGDLTGEDIYSQTRQAIMNAKYILNEASSGLQDIVKCNIYITDMEDYDEMNKAYEELMVKPYPSRACVQVSALSPGSKVEMQFVAYVQK